jgi:hypothetical protein
MEQYSMEQIAEFLAKVPLVEARINALREFAYNRACAGEKIPGFKLVDKRATRKWTDKAELEARLTSEDVDFYEAPELKSPAQVEKIMGKKKFARLVGDLVKKESSGHTLVPESDPRPSVSTAQLEDFEVL